MKYVKKGELPVEETPDERLQEDKPQEEYYRYRGRDRKGRGRRGRGYKQRRHFDRPNYYERRNYERKDNNERQEWRDSGNRGYKNYDRKDKYEETQWEKPANWESAESFTPARQNESTKVACDDGKESTNTPKGKLNIGARPFVKAGKGVQVESGNGLQASAGAFVPKGNIQPQFIPYGYVMPSAPMMIPAMPYPPNVFVPQSGNLPTNV